MASSTSRRTFLLTGAAVSAAAQTKITATPAASVRYRMLGKTGLKVTELGFGSEAVSDITVFERAVDAGLNFFDTARSCQGGNAEQALGAALRGKRDRVVLCTRSYADNDCQISLDLDASLPALGTDHVDIWYLGQKDSPRQITLEMLAAQRAAQKAGKTRFRGLSSHRPAAVAEFAIREKFDDSDSLQLRHRQAARSVQDGRDESRLGPRPLQGGGIGVVAMKVITGGYRQLKIDEKNVDIHARPGSRIAAIRWALRKDRVQTTSVRMTDAAQLEENLRAMSGEYSQSDERLLAAYTDSVRPVLCRMCGACDGQCPQGTPVADVVRAVMYAEGYGQFNMGATAFRRRVQSLACSECSTCAVACPNAVGVAERMRRGAGIVLLIDALRTSWQLDFDDQAALGSIRGLDGSMMDVDRALRDREAQAGALGVIAGHAAEGAEDFGEQVLRHTGSVVPHAQ
jgi:aryl-alcohol dehydrogenase-like predicted oxidoreductase